MSLISPVALEQAAGTIKEGYEMFMKNVGTIPQPFRLLSVSPVLFDLQLKRTRYFGKHPKLSFALLAHIRYLAACRLKYPYCTDFNKRLLMKLGNDETTLAAIASDPRKSLLEENESAMLEFVIKAMDDPSSISAKDIESLKNFGWDESDMVDALAQGVSMIDHAIMMQVFKFDQNCLLQPQP